MPDQSSTTAPSAAAATLRAALRLALAFALIKLLLHVAANLWQTHLGWGYFRDEFYYIACGRHLAWGYVDHGPLVAVQARLAETLFGHSLLGLRLPAALAGSARIALTGLLAYALGGRRAAQSLAMLAGLVAPQYLALDSFLSMNSFESLFWMICLLALITLQRRLRLTPEEPSGNLSSRGSSSPAVSAFGPWLLFGLSAGLGLLNKPSMTFFLVALGLALLLTRTGRALLLRREALAGIVLLIAIASPNLLWQSHNHWPTLEFLQNGRSEGKNTILPPLPFLSQQIQTLNPFTLVLWVPGLVWLLRRAAWRWLGLTYLLFLGIMIALHAKDYYVSPIYPILFAAGGLAWEARRWSPFGKLSAADPATRSGRLLAFPLYQASLILSGLVLLPLSIPVFTPQTWLRYTHALHLYGRIGQSENTPTGPLPQFYADRFGWQEEADQVTRIYNALSPADRAIVTIYCSNYGEAGALQFLAPGLPRVISGQNTYWLWGPGNATGEVMLVISGDSPERLHDFYDDVKILGSLDFSPYQMPFERHHTIFLARDPRQTLPLLWPEFQEYL